MVKEAKPKIIKKPRGDKIRNRAKIIKEVLKDPTQSQRKIAKKVKTSVSTVNEHIKWLPNSNKSEHIEKILEKDLQIVNIATDLLINRLELAQSDPESKMSTRDIISSADVSAKRYSLFKWDITDKDWGLKDQTLSDKQLQAIESLKSFMKWS